MSRLPADSADVVNPGASYYNGKIYYITLDVQTVAVDANTGKSLLKF